MNEILKITKFSINLFIGGTSKGHNLNIKEEFGGNIIVGTPGKLREIFTSEKFEEKFDIKDLEILVLGTNYKEYFF